MEQRPPQDVLQYSIDEIIGLLDSPQEEVSSHVSDIIKNLLIKVNSRWLTDGLLDQFLQSKSKKLLELILWAPEHHWKFLMDRIQEGLKGADRVQYTSILLFAVSTNPPFPWIKKLPEHPIMKEILLIVNPHNEKDISVIVSGLMFLVVLLPTVPADMVQHLTKMLDLFWLLMQHKPLDSALKVYLQIAVFAFFQRLYALYPCRLVGFLRYHSDAKSLYENTLLPMLAKVRLHPFLLTETKETEIRKDRWRGKNRHDLVQECAQISLDTFMDIPEGVSYATHFRSRGASSSDRSTSSDLGNYFSLKAENRIWSPGVMQSPARSSTSITPVYSSQFSRTMSRSSIAESPLETAVEAISQTATPCDESPFVSRDSFSPRPAGDVGLLTARAKIFPRGTEIAIAESVQKFDTNSLRQEIGEFLGPETQSENFFANLVTPRTVDTEREPSPSDATAEVGRKRKQSVYSKESCTNIVPIEEELPGSGDSSRRNSCDSTGSDEEGRPAPGNEGLGTPSQASWTELIKTVNTKRLRFLSQCGPPPDLSKCNVGSNTSEAQPIPKLKRSLSYPNVNNEGGGSFSSSITRKDLCPSLSPLQMVTEDVCTQTEQVEVIEPYEQLIEALKGTPAFPKDNVKTKRSPNGPDEMAFEALDDVMKDLPDRIYSSDIVFDWSDYSEETRDSFMQQLRCLFALLKVEKFKKEAYAERNKRLFSKIKHCSYLSEKQKSLEFDLRSLSDEVAYLRNHQATLKNTIATQEHQIESMTDRDSLRQVQSACDAALMDKEYLKELCKSLALEKEAVQEDLKCSQSKLEDAKRKMTVCSFHSEQNDALKGQLQNHQKQILLMGELYQEMQAQLSTYQDPERYMSMAKYQQYADRVEDERQQNQCESRDQVTRLRAATLRIYQLQQELLEKDQYAARQQAEMCAMENTWRERYNSLSSRQGAAPPEGSVLNGFGDTERGHGSDDREN